jgi:hypothetical protein
MKEKFAALKRISLTAQQKASAIGAAVGTGLLLVGTTVHAALPESVETDAAAAKTDISEAGGIAIGVLMAVLLFAWIRRVLR